MRSGDPFVLLLATVPEGDVGESIAETLVAERLAACVNRIPSVRSVYRWEGEVEREEEQLLIVKTNRKNLEQVESRLGELHPYDVPEMLVVPITKGSSRYLDWLAESLL